ncbi:phosphoenolpyruvate--protein phosphotransferase [Pseudonocardia kunmingensis]|uniref:Phosphocarrier protein HPr n=1 Tax=Pseudonocardia kunmingensis TaxID=630975 RepID=A0A543DWT5_9PSEU|nr:phosphoenolpyruvate--protein phosphotransferase [Pseudonocardia kunmingensis]TQM13797.1 phosphocarrier protein FPr [Pseudonocardia kunmingensis]
MSALVGLVVVSHSRALADAAVALAREMAPGELAIEVAAGLDEATFGTDAVAIAAAIGAADSGAGVVVLMDLGSAVLSAELALDLLDDPAAGERVLLCPAPLVEGLVVAAVTAAGGADRAEVAAEAARALGGKQAQLGAPPDAAAGGGPVDGPRAPAGSGADTTEFTAEFTVANAHGLHARPAARLAALARGLDGAEVRVRNVTTGSDPVPAASLAALTALGALAGHRVEVSATGPRAAAAIDAVLTLAARRFDEPDAAPAPPAPSPAPSGDGPLAASPGIGIGPKRAADPQAPVVPDEPGGDPATERARLDAALPAVAAEIRAGRDAAARELGPAEAAIFDAHLLLLDDPGLLAGARAGIDGGASAPRAWADATDRSATALEALPDPYLAARAADVRAVAAQVLRALVGSPAVAAADEGGPAAVLVAADLTPAQAAALDPERVAGVVLAAGSPTAHSAILLRARGVPAVVGAGAAVLDVPDGTVLALDGETGELAVDPQAAALAGFRDRAAARAEREAQARRHAADPAATRDGTTVLVGANVGSPADAAAAAAAGADLAGLVRTEFLFLGRAAAPDVDEQQAAYTEIAEALGGRRITVRTLDVGGDKPLPYLPLPAEANPFLGLRGIRLAAGHPGLLADQLLAAVRVAHETPVSLMFPMVAALDELVTARRALDAAIAAEGRGTPPGLQVGIMVEVPAAALKAAAFVPHVDFFSIGTNDLTQYALAAERGNPAVAALADPLDPGVLRLVDAVCRAAGERALVAVCGEAAADPVAAELLVGLGVRELSTAPPAVPGTKQGVRELDVALAAPRAAAALTADGPAAVRAVAGSDR